VKAAELITDTTRYDAMKYLDLLLSAVANILSPFGYSTKKLREEVLY
jgi:DNA polymerase elongation subunit (family B)